MKGNIAIIKHTDNGETQIETPENGATFEIYLKSSGSFDAAEDDERDVIVCDENGFGQTKDMPYGVYTVHQTAGWEGRELMKDFDVFIAQDGQTYRYLINNANFESYIKVVKVDAESGKNIPYAGAGFKIFDPDGNQVTMTFTYPTPTTIDTFYTDANGQLVTPEKLEYGKGYSLVEVQAPYGYVLDSTPVYFDVAEENSSDEGGITVIKVDKPNMAQKGTVSIEKTGEVFSGVNISGEENADVIYQPVYEVKGLAGAVYEIAAAEDIITPDGTLRYAKGEVVDTVTTDENGLAKSKELYLGKYTVVEITAPEGMVINKEAHEVELTYAGQEVAVTETATSFVNERQKVTVSLEKAIEKNDIFNIGNGDEVKNISFGLFAGEELFSASGTSIPADGLIEIISLSESGKAVIKTDLPFGSYYVVLLQKQITTQTLPFKKQRNHGEQPMYYVENSNPAIVSRETYEAVQALIKSRQPSCKRKAKTYPLTRTLLCPDCAHTFRRQVVNGTAYWLCAAKATNKTDCVWRRVKEDEVYAAFNLMIRKVQANREYLLGTLIRQLEELQYRTTGSQQRIKEIDREIADLTAQNLVLSRLHGKGVLNAADYTAQSDVLENKITELRIERRTKITDSDENEMLEELKMLNDILKEVEIGIDFDAELFEQTVDSITVDSNELLTFHLAGGISLPEKIREKGRCYQA